MDKLLHELRQDLNCQLHRLFSHCFLTQRLDLEVQSNQRKDKATKILHKVVKRSQTLGIPGQATKRE
jgi:hypothetical protein